MRNKSGSLSSHIEKLQRPTAAVVQEAKKKPQQQQVVADLISLDTNDDRPMVFDPLASDYSNNGHKKLSRTGTEQSRKYENYQPAGGSGSQPQFRQFVATMTSADSSQPSLMTHEQPRSSADSLLADYGLNFKQASLSNSIGSQQHLNSTSNSTTQHHPVVTATYRPPYQTSYMPPPPLVPPRTSNSSFLHSTLPLGSSVSSASMMYSQSNSRPVPPPPSSNSRNATNCRTDTLADLDPLRKTSVVDASKLEPLRGGTSDAPMNNNNAPRNVAHGLAPPTVPPRSKKQWTTFD